MRNAAHDKMPGHTKLPYPLCAGNDQPPRKACLFVTIQWRLRADDAARASLDEERAIHHGDAERVSTPVRGIATNQLTIRGLDEQLATYVRDFALREGISLNCAAIQLLRRGAELDQSKADVVESSLDHLMGTWTTEEADRIDQALEDFSGIDRAMWK